MVRAQKRNVIDATRMKDGAKVILKCVGASSQEFQIALHLSSAKMRSDPRNRTVPIIDVISLSDNTNTAMLVMPYFRVFHTPPFHCRGEVVEALRQFLQVCQSRCSRTRRYAYYTCIGSRVHARTQYITWVHPTAFLLNDSLTH